MYELFDTILVGSDISVGTYLICLLAAVICLFASGFSVTAVLKTTGQSIGSLWKKRERTRIRHKKKKGSKKPVLQPEEL